MSDGALGSAGVAELEIRDLVKRLHGTIGGGAALLQRRGGRVHFATRPKRVRARPRRCECIAGFETPSERRHLSRRRAHRPAAAQPAQHRAGVSSYALFPHLTIFDNVAFGLRLRKLPAAETKRRVGDALNLVGLSDLIDRYPRELSGGQQQAHRDRALGRAGAAHHPVRRAVVEPRLQAPRRDAHRAARTATAARQDHDLRHARSGRGTRALRPDRCHVKRPHRADRVAAGDLREAGQSVRRGPSSETQTCSTRWWSVPTPAQPSSVRIAV